MVQDLRRLSLTYSGLSLAYQEIGQFNQAVHYAQRAMTIHETLNDRISLARSENNLGLMLVRAGETAKARAHFERSLRLFEENGVEAAKAAVLLSLSELALAESRTHDAARFANQALELAGRLSESGTVSEAHIWLGKIAAASGDNATADARFANAFAVLGELGGSPERLSRAHAHYAEILEARGDIAGAVQHLKQALAARPSHRALESTEATA